MMFHPPTTEAQIRLNRLAVLPIQIRAVHLSAKAQRRPLDAAEQRELQDYHDEADRHILRLEVIHG